MTVFRLQRQRKQDWNYSNSNSTEGEVVRRHLRTGAATKVGQWRRSIRWCIIGVDYWVALSITKTRSWRCHAFIWFTQVTSVISGSTRLLTRLFPMSHIIHFIRTITTKWSGRVSTLIIIFTSIHTTGITNFVVVFALGNWTSLTMLSLATMLMNPIAPASLSTSLTASPRIRCGSCE